MNILALVLYLLGMLPVYTLIRHLEEHPRPLGVALALLLWPVVCALAALVDAVSPLIRRKKNNDL